MVALASNPVAAFRGVSQGGDGFPSPWLDVASLAMPSQLKTVLDWCQFIWHNSSAYRRSQERIVSYFLTDLEVGAAGASKALGDDEKEKWTDFCERAAIRSAIQNLDLDTACYGNAFASIHVPFRRYLSCPKCGFMAPLRVIAETKEFGYRWQNFEFRATCQQDSCRYSGPWQITDLPDELDKNIRVKIWPPQQIEIVHDLLSGDSAYIWRIPADYKAQVRRGELFVLERCPVQVLRAIQHDQMFQFHPGVLFHMREPTRGGIVNRGWGISRILTNFRDIWHVQVLRRYNEAIALDYIIPFRVITPEVRSGTNQLAYGQEIDPLLTMNMGDFRSQVEHMLRLRRRDPARWNVLSFPVRYMALGGDAQQLAPREMMDQAIELMLNAGGSPVQLYRGDLEWQTAGPALRLFEADNYELVHNNNFFLRWFVEQVCQLLSWEAVAVRMKRVMHADDIQKQMAILQLAMGGVVSRTEALQMLNLDFKDEVRRMAEEARFEQLAQAEVEEEMEQTAFGQQMAKGAPAGGGPAGMAPASPGGVPADPSGQGAAPGPVASMITGGGTPTTPEDMIAQAESLAQQLLSLPESQKDSELRALKQKNQPLHAIVRQKMDEIRNRARTAGASMLLGQQPAAG